MEAIRHLARALALSAVGLGVGNGAPVEKGKVAVCHVPPGDPGARETIHVGAAAVPAHLAHGDEVGECEAGCGGSADRCDDGNPCTSDACLPDGTCAHTPATCDDGNVCTGDGCDPSVGCTYAPVAGSCDDGKACTAADACVDGACRGVAIPDCCASDVDCDDLDACTSDTCDATGKCSNEPLVCGSDDKCLAAYCDPANGSCSTTPVVCDDGDACTDNLCHKSSGCYFPPAADPPETCGAPVVVGPYYGTSLQWNDYVRNDGPTPFDSSGTACTGDEAGPYAACVHAGEMAAVAVPGHTTCDALAATDALGAFNWICRPGLPTARMVSSGLRADARLADLIDFVGLAWKPNSVTVTEGDVPILITASSAWHANPIVAVSGTVTASSPGTVYVVPEDVGGTVTVAAPRVAVVVGPAARLRPGSFFSGPIRSQGGRFLWAEGALISDGSYPGVAWTDVRFSVLRKVRLQRGGFSLAGSSSNRLVDLHAADWFRCLTLDASSGLNVIDGFAGFGCDVVGVQVQGSNNVLAHVNTSNGRIGVYFDGGSATASNVLLNAMANANLTYALWADLAPRTTVTNFASVVSGTGIAFSGATTTGQVRHAAVTDTWVSDTPTHGTGLREDSGISVAWNGTFKLGLNERDCQTGLAAVPCSTLLDPGAVVKEATLVPSFVGKVYSDSANASDTDGTATYLTSLDFTSFDNALRGWGREGTYPSAAMKDACGVSMTCRIWDWSLRSADTEARDALPDPARPDATTLVHVWTTPGGASECAAIPGAAWTGTDCQSVFVECAAEITGDFVGNDNVLCEAGEDCLVTRNLGAYQGHGALEPVGVGGPTGDMRFWRHAANGR